MNELGRLNDLAGAVSLLLIWAVFGPRSFGAWLGSIRYFMRKGELETSLELMQEVADPALRKKHRWNRFILAFIGAALAAMTILAAYRTAG